METHDTKPSFFGTVVKGAWGYLKGLTVGLSVGLIGGGIVGALIGTLAGGNAAFGAVIGAKIGGSALGSVGAIAGTMTEIVRSREPSQAEMHQREVKIAKESFEKGVSVALQHDKGSHWQDRRAKELAAQALDTGQRLHS